MPGCSPPPGGRGRSRAASWRRERPRWDARPWRRCESGSACRRQDRKPSLLLPARLLDARDLALLGQAAEADPADPELAHIGTRASTQAAAAVGLDREARPPGRLGDERLLGQLVLSPAEWHAEADQQAACLVVGAGGGDDGDLHATRLVDL